MHIIKTFPLPNFWYWPQKLWMSWALVQTWYHQASVLFVYKWTGLRMWFHRGFMPLWVTNCDQFSSLCYGRRESLSASVCRVHDHVLFTFQSKGSGLGIDFCRVRVRLNHLGRRVVSCSPIVPDGAGRRRQRAHEVSNVVWNVDGQWGDLRLHRLHRGLRSLALHFLPTGQGRERDLDVGAGEPEGAPAKGKTVLRPGGNVCPL